MRFKIGDQYSYNDNKLDTFYLTDDLSLLYRSHVVNYNIYNISLGGNWRFQLMANCNTGQCLAVECYLDKLYKVVNYQSLIIPKFERRKLYFIANERMQQGSGCYYVPFCNEVFYDIKNKVLCLGDNNADGKAIEFMQNIIAIIDNGNLKCIYLILDSIADIGDCFCVDENS